METLYHFTIRFNLLTFKALGNVWLLVIIITLQAYIVVLDQFKIKITHFYMANTL